jgi:CheY-like chemotaxis protein
VTDTVILLVDDEKTVLDSLSAQLERHFAGQLECEAAESAAEAWEVIDELLDDGVKVVVVVSDWLMPGQRGDEFLAQLRGRHPGIGRILLTGQAEPSALEKARSEAQVHRILFKPWRPEDLLAAIEESMVVAGAAEAGR